MPVQRGRLDIQATGYGAHLQFFEALFVQQSERHVDDLAFMNFHKRYVPVARVFIVDYTWPFLNHVQWGRSHELCAKRMVCGWLECGPAAKQIECDPHSQ